MPQCKLIPATGGKLCKKGLSALYTQKNSHFLKASVGSTGFKTMNETYLNTKQLPRFKVPTHSFTFKCYNYIPDNYKRGQIMTVFRGPFVVILLKVM